MRARLLAEIEEERRIAHERSIELLRSWLTPVQLAEFDGLQRFIVRGSETGERYRITSPAMAYNVAELNDTDEIVARFCFVPQNDVRSHGDIMLAQKIMLETDELRARSIANRLDRASMHFGFYGG